MRQHILTAINEVLSEGGRVPLGEVLPGTRLRQDVGLDSLELAVLTVKLEAATGVDIFAGGIVNTIGEIEERLRGK